MFHRPKPKQFNYKSIYSDLEKEEKQGKNNGLSEFRIKLRDERSRKMGISPKQKGINITIYIIITLMLLYYIFF